MQACVRCSPIEPAGIASAEIAGRRDTTSACIQHPRDAIPDMARPTTYSPALGESICERVAQGETLASICRDLGIAYRTVNDWRNQYPEFGAKMGTARECGHDVIAESCLQIADTEPDPNRGKLRVWTRLQLLAKWDPRRYGERSQIDLGGQQGNPVQHVLNVEFVPGRKVE